MNVDRPDSLVICPALRCCDNSRSRRNVGPKASCRLGPDLPRSMGTTERGSLRRMPVIEPSFRNGSRLGHSRSSSATRASRTTTCAHRGDAAALVRRNVGTWDPHDDVTMSRWILGPGFHAAAAAERKCGRRHSRSALMSARRRAGFDQPYA